MPFKNDELKISTSVPVLKLNISDLKENVFVDGEEFKKRQEFHDNKIYSDQRYSVDYGSKWTLNKESQTLSPKLPKRNKHFIKTKYKENFNDFLNDNKNLEKYKKWGLTQSYEPLASISTSPWSDKKQESNWKQEQEKNSRDEKSNHWDDKFQNQDKPCLIQ